MARAGFISFFFSIIFVWYIIGRIRLFWRRYNMKGRLFGVGVGPGDPELMTYKAVRTRESCQKDHRGTGKGKRCSISDIGRSNDLFDLYVYSTYYKGKRI